MMLIISTDDLDRSCGRVHRGAALVSVLEDWIAEGNGELVDALHGIRELLEFSHNDYLNVINAAKVYPEDGEEHV